MNRKQKACLLVGIVAIVAMGLFPPWVLERSIGRGKYTTEPGPYSWISNPPATARFIDLYRLGVQFFVVAVVTAGLIVILKEKKGKNKSPITISREFIFALLFFVTVGLIIPPILCFYLVNECNWDDEGAFLLWFIFLLFSAGIWIHYLIIRCSIIILKGKNKSLMAITLGDKKDKKEGKDIKTPDERQEVKIPAVKGHFVKKMIILVAVGLSFFVSGFLLCWSFTPDEKNVPSSEAPAKKKRLIDLGPASSEEMWMPESAVLIEADAQEKKPLGGWEDALRAAFKDEKKSKKDIFDTISPAQEKNVPSFEEIWKSKSADIADANSLPNLPEGFILESRQSKQTIDKNSDKKNRKQ